VRCPCKTIGSSEGIIVGRKAVHISGTHEQASAGRLTGGRRSPRPFIARRTGRRAGWTYDRCPPWRPAAISISEGRGYDTSEDLARKWGRFEQGNLLLVPKAPAGVTSLTRPRTGAKGREHARGRPLDLRAPFFAKTRSTRPIYTGRIGRYHEPTSSYETSESGLRHPKRHQGSPAQNLYGKLRRA